MNPVIHGAPSVPHPARWNETSEDVARETQAAARLAKAFGFTHVQKLQPLAYRVDFAAFRGQDLVAWLEYKHRSRRYSTVIFPAAKLVHGKTLSREFGVPFLFAVEWPDIGLHVADLTDFVAKARLGGSHRGQNGDIEPVVDLPLSLFKPVTALEALRAAQASN